MGKHRKPWRVEVPLLLFWVILTAFFFAEVEIQIEGPAGWAANLPTWRIEKHWLLDLFWGGRPMTGYHAWVFSFMFLVFHLGVFINLHWSLRTEGRILASLMLFWVLEDFMWFLFNPSFGFDMFYKQKIPWHKHWFLRVPVDYWTFTLISMCLMWLSYAKFKGEK